MRPRIRSYFASLAFGAAVITVALWMFDCWKLMLFRHHAEQEFAQLIAAFESGSTDWPYWSDDSPLADTKRQRIMEKIEEATPATIAIASWSHDGHHGPQAFKWSGINGYSTYPYWWSSNWGGSHTARFGRTFDGRPLLIFGGWQNRGAYREYEFAILAD